MGIFDVELVERDGLIHILPTTWQPYEGQRMNVGAGGTSRVTADSSACGISVSPTNSDSKAKRFAREFSKKHDRAMRVLASDQLSDVGKMVSERREQPSELPAREERGEKDPDDGSAVGGHGQV